MEKLPQNNFEPVIELTIVAVGVCFLVFVIGIMLFYGDKHFTDDEPQVCTSSEKEMMFEIKSLSAERHRLNYELALCQSAMYPVPADIQEPLPYKP